MTRWERATRHDDLDAARGPMWACVLHLGLWVLVALIYWAHR